LRLLTLQTQLLTFTLPPCANVLLTEDANDKTRLNWFHWALQPLSADRLPDAASYQHTPGGTDARSAASAGGADPLPDAASCISTGIGELAELAALRKG
jgi:hypothetical protein